MAKQLNVNLAFTADTKAAQMQLKQLQQQLDAVMQPKNLDTSKGFTAEIQKGVAAASELKVKLMDATNVNTGKLDLTKFSQSLQTSNRQLEDYAKDLAALGPQGSEAFISVARAISNAETPFIRLNARAQEFLTTLKNTARWQISSSILHGFMGTLQHAYGYAQDLNESLNNIRIVTSKSSDEMARFAKEANAAARNLSATTLDYTDASLIYYQQGLSDQEVVGRTNTTIKLANVSRQSAEEVSDQMTAIWNNFYDGSKSLEYYADVITALGAATASSSEEISTGLEKFAAVSKTVGLSYEYATAALATITATTRQSADTVGTGLRTLFARLEGLKLGETLEDGVDLNKYSKALNDVGVQVLDTTGQMKDMDTILEDLAARWGDLDKAQRMALAQTVGGVRQYTNLIALMDNWDFMQSNLNVARGSEGTLQKQADIYAESWEAAQKRVKAAAEAIYDALLNDEFFINLTKGLATILDGINGIIKSAGGLRGVLLGLSAILSKMFSASMTKSISTMASSISTLTKNGKADAIELKNKAWDLGAEVVKDDGTTYGRVRYENIQRESELQKKLIEGASTLSDEERKIYQQRLDIIRTYQDEAAAQAKILDQMQEQEGQAQLIIKGKIQASVKQGGKGTVSDFDNYRDAIRNAGAQSRALTPIIDSLDKIKEKSMSIVELRQHIEKLPTSAQAAERLDFVFNLISESVKGSEISVQDFNDILKASLEDDQAEIQRLANKFEDPLRKEVLKVGEQIRQTDEQQAKFNQTNEQAGQVADKLGGKLPNLTSKYQQLGQAIATTAQLISSVGFAINGIVSFIDNLKQSLEDGELSLSEIGMLLTSFGMVLTSVIGVLNTLKTSQIGVTIASKVLSQAQLDAAIAFGGTQAAVLTTITTLLPYIAILGAVAGAIYLVYRHLNKEEIAAKKAAKEHEKLAKAADKTHEEFVSLKSDLENYDNALETLKSATKNTEEWAEAAQAVNDAFDQLKKNHPDIMAKARYGFENGQLVIQNADELIKEAEQADKKASEASLVSAYKAANAKTIANRRTSYRNEFAGAYNNGMSNADINALVDSILEGDLSSVDINGKVEEYIYRNGIKGTTAGNIKKIFTSDEGRQKLGQLANERASSELERISAAQQLAYEKGGPGLTDESYNKIVDAILKTDTNKSDEEFIAAVQAAIEGMNLVKIPENIANLNGESVNVDGELANIESLQKLLSDENAGAEDFLGLGINWEALGTSVTEFVDLTEQEQQRLLLAYQADLQEAQLATEKARIEKLEGEERTRAEEELSIKQSLYQKKILEDLAKVYGLNEEEVKDLAEYYEDYGGGIAGLSKDLKNNAILSSKIATANSRLNKGLEDLSDNWEDYSKILKDNNKNTEEYQRTLKNLRNNLKDILGLDLDSLSEGFFDDADNLALIAKAAEGDIEAIQELRRVAALDIALGGIDDEELRAELTALSNELYQYALNNNLEIGATIDDTDFINKCNEIIAAAGFTADQAAEYFKALGYDVDLEMAENTSTSTIRTRGTVMAFTDKGTSKGTPYEKPINTIATTTTTTQVPVVRAITYKGSAGGTVNFKNRGGGGGSKGGGGGGSEKKTKDEGDMDRYHYIKETIEDLETAYSRASKEKDRLFGADRVKAINAEVSAIEDLIKEQDIYLNSIDDYLDKDAANLVAKVKEYTGIAPILDEIGRIVNYDDIMKAGIKKYNSDTSDSADDSWSKFEDSISQYEETKNLREEQRERRADLIRERQDKNFEKLNYVLELRMDVNENELKTVETAISLLGDSVYKSAERLDLLWSSSLDVTDKFDNLNEAIGIQVNQLGRLDMALAAADISNDQYMQGLKDIRDELQKNLETLIEYDNEMETYYSTTLQNASEEMDFWTKQLERSTTVLEHYKKVIELSGNKQNYGMLSVLLKGQKVTTENEYNTARQWYEVVKQQRAGIEQEMRDAQRRVDLYDNDKNSKEYKAAIEQVEWLRDKFNAIEEEYVQAEEQMYSKLEAFLEATKADLENDLDEISHRYELLMSNGLGFEYIQSDLDKLKTIQDEYLTKTNQVYETTKFLRQIQSDMDKTDNVASKEKIKNFQKLFENLREQGKLSQVELEIAKRRYEIELAQMALEDAKNAKSVVRLSRDNEGNYGYVYSADPDKINDAEQNLVDKQNDLYNYALETYNLNKQKLAELWTKQQDELMQLKEYYYTNGLELDDTYNKKKAEIIKRYEDEALIYIQNVNESRNVLNEVALTDYTEAYASHYDDIISTEEGWKEKTNEFINEIDGKYTDWKDLVAKEVRPIVGESLKDLEIKTGEVEKASDSLAKIIKTQVVPQLQDELIKVDDVTEAYGRQRDMIWEVIDALQQQLSLIDQKVENETGGAIEAAGGYYSENVDYGTLTAAYLANGGRIGDSTYTQIMAQTSAKVAAHKAQGKGREDWGYTAGERTERYKNMSKEELIYDAKGMNKSDVLNLLDKIGISASFGTGGYTGSWGNNEGRLAFLHQKELILNEDDTANMLKTIQFVRDIANMIDLQATSTAAGIGGLYTPSIGVASTGLDQNVHIEANFPSVTDHNEIEEALTTLINRASQFANRK